MKHLNVLIVSAASMGNMGDNIVSLVNEAIVLDLCDSVKVRHAVLMNNVEEDVDWSDIVVIGGGGILYDWSLDNVDNYMYYADLAKYRGRKVIFSGVGTQGINTRYGKRRYSESLNRADLLLVRDEKDALKLSSIGVSIPIHTLPDLSFLLPHYLPCLQDKYGYSELDISTELRRFMQGSLKPVLGVSLSSEYGSALNREVDSDRKAKRNVDDDKKVKLLQKLNRDYKVVLITQSNDDTDLYNKIRDSIPDVFYIPPLSFIDTLGVYDIYRQVDTVLTSRYHGFTVGVVLRKPTIAITGENTAKIQKTIQSQLPSYSKNMLSINDITDENKLEFNEYSHLDSMDYEVNTLIEKSFRYIPYIKSIILGG